eukprot:CAMPEP_0179444076 /NCGR_PEP_ID=MMETSP0799-20121207/27563_1 /TAXON_ID=46947 /ORGANISM="Geminigera cryophila, Strain CCMP2564" /LENGTH=51 /DNA_ID=CAMNT_0021230839 /DNA_START=85 /DNA_END=240 /DNA_ORIENTATION=-
MARLRLRQQMEMGALILIGCGSAFALYGVYDKKGAATLLGGKPTARPPHDE